MKIAHVTDYFQPRAGYQEYFLAHAHQRAGHQVTVVASDRYFPFPSYESTWGPLLGGRIRSPGWGDEQGLEVLRLPVWMELPASAVVFMRGLGRALDELAPDVVIGHTILSPTSLILARAQRRLGFRLVVDSHVASFNSRLDDTYLKRAYMFLYRHVTAPLLRTAGRIAAIGVAEQAVACEVLDLPARSVRLIPLGADIHRFGPVPSGKESSRARLGLTRSDLVLVHAGKLTPEKDVHVLVQVVRDLQARWPHLKLLLVGAGSAGYQDELRRIAGPDRARWLLERPMVDNEILADLLRAADLGVWPGNFSQVIPEALATGLPVVVPQEALRGGDPCAHLVSRDNGRQFPRGDAGKLAATIEALIADPAELERMGQSSRSLATEELSWEAIARQFLELAGP